MLDGGHVRVLVWIRTEVRATDLSVDPSLWSAPRTLRARSSDQEVPVPRPDVDIPRRPRWHVGAPTPRGNRHGVAVINVSGLHLADLSRRRERMLRPATTATSRPAGSETRS